MPIKFNPFSGQFDLVNNDPSASAVTGPGSSTDNAIARFDGTAGTTIQNSPVTISDSTGKITITPVAGASNNLPLLDFANAADQDPSIDFSATTSVTGLQFTRDGTVVARIWNNGNLQSAHGFSTVGALIIDDYQMYLNNGPKVKIRTVGDAGPGVEISNMSTDTAYTSTFQITSPAATIVGEVIKGAASQSGDLTQWQNSLGTPLASISAAGIPKTPGIKWTGSTSGILTHAATAITTNHTLTWPANNAAGALTNNGSGALSWSASSGANTALSNLASVAVNADIDPGSDRGASFGDATHRFEDNHFYKATIYDSGLHLRSEGAEWITLQDFGISSPSGAPLDLAFTSSTRTGENSTGWSFQSGSVATSGTSGGFSVTTGLSAGNSGAITFNTGNASNTMSGSFQVETGTASNNSGTIEFLTGTVNGGNSKGLIQIASGNGLDVSNSGDVTIKSGTTAEGDSGSLFLTTGVVSGAGTRGYIQFDSLVAVLPVGTSSPSTSYPNGSCYYNTSTNKIMVLNGGTWRGILVI